MISCGNIITVPIADFDTEPVGHLDELKRVAGSPGKGVSKSTSHSSSSEAIAHGVVGLSHVTLLGLGIIAEAGKLVSYRSGAEVTARRRSG